MWLMTKHGFYSVVQKKPGIYHVRARERRDLLNLTGPGGPLSGEPIHQGSSDYPYRVIVGAVEVRRLMEFLAQALDYPNFKAEIHKRPDQRRKPYYRVWDILAQALGAYGDPADAQEETEWTTTYIMPLWKT